MDTIKIQTNTLLGIVKENLVKHDQIYSAAVSGYFDIAGKRLNEFSEKIKNREQIPSHLGLDFPPNYAQQYHQAIRMFELSVDTVVELTQEQFAQYVMNEWRWRDSFKMSNSRYLTGFMASGCAAF